MVASRSCWQTASFTYWAVIQWRRKQGKNQIQAKAKCWWRSHNEAKWKITIESNHMYNGRGGKAWFKTEHFIRRYEHAMAERWPVYMHAVVVVTLANVNLCLWRVSWSIILILFAPCRQLWVYWSIILKPHLHFATTNITRCIEICWPESKCFSALERTAKCSVLFPQRNCQATPSQTGTFFSYIFFSFSLCSH